MKLIFQKSTFPKSPGGDRYEWKEAETAFDLTKDGFFAIRIEASAKNSKKNKTSDDDDLRIALDGFDVGKYEQNKEEGAWKGFNTASSWNGASLKGGTKIIYYFVNLAEGKHVLQFFADEKPVLKSIEIYEIINHSFELSDLRPPERIKSEHKGIPWLSFVFLGTPSKSITLGVNVRSAKSKKGTDGDNLKVVVNGETLNNLQAPDSDKYKNFYFSGDLKEFDVLNINDERLAKSLAFGNAVELWYDEEPEITNLKINFFNEKEFLKYLDSLGLENLKESILKWAHRSIAFFRFVRRHKYSAALLEHAITENPQSLIFQPDDPIIRLIKKDPVYTKILEKIKQKITDGILDGEIWPIDFEKNPEMKGEINFDSDDLKTSLHGIHKIDFRVTEKKDQRSKVEITFWDVYDFNRAQVHFPYAPDMVNNLLDRGQAFNIIQNYEIEIHITEKIKHTP